jgi:hypothetical protein
MISVGITVIVDGGNDDTAVVGVVVIHSVLIATSVGFGGD